MHRKFTFDRATGAGVELYRNSARYITVSGLELGSCPEIPPIDDFIDTVFARLRADPTARPMTATISTMPPAGRGSTTRI